MKFIMLFKSILSSLSSLGCSALYNPPPYSDKLYNVCLSFKTQKKAIKKEMKEAYSMPIEKFFAEKKNS